LQSEVSNLRVALPEDVGVLEVKGKDLRDWKISKNEGQQYLDVYLNFGVRGNYLLELTFERNIGEGSVTASVPWVKAVGVEREKGYFGLAASTNVELSVDALDNVMPLDIKELPSMIWSRTVNPILLAFKYLTHPFSITIDVTRHKELPVLVAAIDSVNYVTLFTEEGKSLTKATYQIRNNVKQFIRLVLPKGAVLWSTFVSGRPVKPAEDAKGNILIPLEKSQLKGEALAQFPVEIAYLDSSLKKMGLFGNLKLNLPKTDTPINELYWSVYLPFDFRYFNFDGDVKNLRTRPGARFGVQGRLSRTQVTQERIDDIGQQFHVAEKKVFADFDKSKMKGVLPIRITVPKQGRFFRLSKLLVTGEESPWISVNYTTNLRQFHGLFWGLVIFTILVLIALFIKRRSKVKIE